MTFWIRRVLALPLAIVLLSFVAGCGDAKRAPSSQFLLLDGTTLTTQSLHGQVTLVNFWATSCISCIREMPHLVDTYTQFKDRGFETIAVAMSYDPPEFVQQFAQSRALPFKVALDHTGDIAREWGDVRLTPTTFIVDKQGRIVKRFLGEPDFDALHQLIDMLLSAV